MSDLEARIKELAERSRLLSSLKLPGGSALEKEVVTELSGIIGGVERKARKQGGSILPELLMFLDHLRQREPASGDARGGRAKPGRKPASPGARTPSKAPKTVAMFTCPKCGQAFAVSTN
ncbi:MAG: hypothetical protein D6743_18470 [Calditrichaeota bacterium]|nr:MAG: hypothetical protein D6743_18470 [Calditrichota bacterium]